LTQQEPTKLKKVAAKARDKTHDALCNLWWWLLLRGVALIVLAVCALFWPQKTVGLLVKILGVYLIIDGLWSSVTYAVSKEKDHSLLVGALGLLVGAVLLFWTGVSGRVFMTIIGIWAVLQGVGLYWTTRNEAQADVEAKSLLKWLAIGLVLAGLVLVIWPSSGVTVIGWLISAVSLLIGGAMVFISMKLRSVGQRIRGIGREPEPSAE
jgi:uncharacterized membrane protein HdeD (DUF308 family)